MDPLKTSPSALDVDMIHAIKSGGAAGDKAIISLYARYQKDIRAYIDNMIMVYHREPQETEDILHDSFIIMIHKIQFENPVIYSLCPYWIGIARYQLLNRLRRNKIENRVLEDDDPYMPLAASPETLFLTKERHHQVEKCISKCSARCQRILMLWLSDYTMQEIAEIMKLSSPNMARKIKHECFKKLKILLIKGNVLSS